MYCEAIGNAVTWLNNRDLLGQPMRDRAGGEVTGARCQVTGTATAVTAKGGRRCWWVE
jgi:hypothetical protein